MRKRILLTATFGIVFILTCVTGVRSQDNIPIVYKFSPDMVTKYRVVQRLTGSNKMPGATTSVAIDAELVTTVAVRCRRVLDDGSAELSFETLDGSLKVRGKPSTYQPPKRPRVLVVSPLGKVLETPPANDDSNLAGRPALDTDMLESCVFVVPLPADTLRSGLTWSAERILGGTTIRSDYRIQSLETKPEGPVASVEQTLSTLPRAVSDRSYDLPEDKCEGKIRIIFSAAKGLMSAEGTVKSVIHSAVQLPTFPSGTEKSSERQVYSVRTIERKFTITALE